MGSHTPGPPWVAVARLPAAALVMALAGCEGDGVTPTADAGADLEVALGQPVTLTGAASTDPNGDALTYSWRFDSVPADSTVENSAFTDNDSPTAVATSFVPDVPGLYGVTLQVSDAEHSSDLDYLTVIAGTGNHAPIADAGPDQYSATSQTTFLYGAGLDEDAADVLTYRWRFELVPGGSELTDQGIYNQGTPNPAIIPDAIGLYVLTLTVSDGEAESQPDYVTVVVTDGNQAPVADAGESASLTPCSGYELPLDGRASYDPEGAEITFTWEVLDSPSGSDPSIDDPGSATPTLTWDVVGYYTVRLVVNDGEKDSTADYAVFETVSPTPNQAPVADAGADVLIESTAFCVGASCSPCGDRVITLDGGGSFDPDNDPLAWQWEVTSGTGWTLDADVNDVASLTIPELSTTFGHTATATYGIRLNVADCQGQDSDEMTITFTCEGG